MNTIPPGPNRRSVLTLGLAATAVVLAAAAVLFAIRHDEPPAATPPASVSTPPIAQVPTSGQPAPGTTAVPEPTRPAAPPTAKPFAYQPLWPFAGAEDAAAWQRAYREGGHQPWHLDAGLIARMFTQQYLGYTNVDKAIETVVNGEHAWVTVGFDRPDGAAAMVAELHLVRIGAGSDAPWEVVGSQDRSLRLTTPAYGAVVGSPVVVGGRITGVDENLRVQIRQLRSGQQVGSLPGIPAGGTNAPWTGAVPFSAVCPGTLTIAVATGGHLAEVERFAITGVRC
ncbi:hypothetical protein [Nocardia sp. NPDC052566]|uniref:hypothetical protein n=1 Tax=Nocardia sp. NPDC052566 TaxID=3364330 RepID=UPI0037C9ECD7